ncbi:MAG: 4Fe-4S dicluster domain-containing protein [Desulfobacterales bacterium]|nr:4Fe-4S dicluster domain-containing protein [Desulfobacterales bacterium]MDJ0912207.1 4Fe-4S dicluster domain-containing protein [Desulfobacterales bacterium]
MTTRVLMSDPNKCTGCGLCRVACSMRKAGVCNPEKSRVRILEMEAYGQYLPLACQHCEDAPCAAACPKEAIYRDSEHVRTVIDYNLCVGCQMCIHACPFGAIGFDDHRGRPFKCDLCGGDPLCVHFCEPMALTFREASMLQYAQTRQSALKLTGVRR